MHEIRINIQDHSKQQQICCLPIDGIPDITIIRRRSVIPRILTKKTKRRMRNRLRPVLLKPKNKLYVFVSGRKGIQFPTAHRRIPLPRTIGGSTSNCPTLKLKMKKRVK